jgi:DNA-binding transcriptional ArsR family regulator
MVSLGKKLLEHIGLNPERLRIEFMSSSDGAFFAQVTNDFVKRVKELGPLGVGEGINESILKLKLEVATRLVPYIKLVETERLGVPVRSEEAYKKFFESEEAERLFNELILNKLVENEIMLLLRRGPMASGEISEALGLSVSEVLSHISALIRGGFVKYDLGQRRFTIALGKGRIVAIR